MPWACVAILYKLFWFYFAWPPSGNEISSKKSRDWNLRIKGQDFTLNARMRTDHEIDLNQCDLWTHSQSEACGSLSVINASKAKRRGVHLLTLVKLTEIINNYVWCSHGTLDVFKSWNRAKHSGCSSDVCFLCYHVACLGKGTEKKIYIKQNWEQDQR